MQTAYPNIVELWKNEYSSQLDKYVPYQLTDQFQRMAAFFSPGRSYYYIMNMQNLQLEYISPEVERIVGYAPEEVNIEKLVSSALEEEIEVLVKKESVIRDFYYRFLSPGEVPTYKIVYTYRMRDLSGKERHILHQAMTLSITEEGKAQHVISIHSDVSHLNIPHGRTLSFISMSRKPSYYNLEVDSGIFNPESSLKQEFHLSRLLTPREIQIIGALSKGLNAQEIAENLHLSFNTVRTHRKNMLKKTGCSNTTELVAKCLMQGIIN